MTDPGKACVFCSIASGAIPAKKVHEDDQVVAFHDLNPQAPTHVLVIPRKHIGSANQLRGEDEALAGRVLLAASRIARDLGIADAGYRMVVNTGDDGGQTVHHLHLHLLGGRGMSWPPG
jgi:histidine triad (HIT) family protein